MHGCVCVCVDKSLDPPADGRFVMCVGVPGSQAAAGQQQEQCSAVRGVQAWRLQLCVCCISYVAMVPYIN